MDDDCDGGELWDKAGVAVTPPKDKWPAFPFWVSPLQATLQLLTVLLPPILSSAL